jgi:1-acyl-sn-glycerol-3-phosphate acyltransferase
MLYRFLRWIAGIALQWFYRDIEVVGIQRLRHDRPLLLAVNHPNALVDALVVGTIAPWPIVLTAKATLFEHPVLRPLFRAVGIVPLRRARDEGQPAGAQPDATRNAEAFRAILDALGRRQAVLIFPEGTTHDRPSLAPLKTGIARLALQARDASGLRGLEIVPVGLTFERKWAPRTRIFVHIGEPIDVDAWQPADGSADRVGALMRDIEQRLRATTLNFETAEEAAEVIGVARILSGAFDRVRSLASPDPRLADEVEIARRVAAARESLLAVAPQQVARFRERLDALRLELRRRRIAVNDVMISRSLSRGAWFAVREGAILLGAGPIAWWGRLNHWVPLRLARWVARRRSRSPEDPAMYTLVLGLALVLLAYAIQTMVVWQRAGPRWALAYLVSLPLAATWDIQFRDRMHRAAQRTRTYLQFWREPGLQARLLTELEWLREEALALEERAAEAGRVPSDPSAMPAGARRSSGP